MTTTTKPRGPQSSALVRVGLALLGVLVVHLLAETAPFRELGLRLYDLRVRALAGLHAPPDEIAIVAIDERSLRELEPALGRWPWPRAAMASVIEYCSEASAVGLDVLYTERDWQFDRSDGVFVDAVEAHGRVVSAVHLVHGIQAAGVPPDLQRFLIPAAPEAVRDAEPFNAVLAPFGQLVEASAGVGHVNAVLDQDGVIRDHAPVARCGKALLPSLPLALALLHTGVAASNLYVDAHNRLYLGPRTLFLDARGEFALLPSRWQHRTYAIGDVIEAWRQESNGELPVIGRDVFRGKVVLIGSLATGMYADARSTPVSAFANGVEILGAALENILNDRRLRRMDWAALPLMLLLGVIPASRRFARPAAMGALCAGLAAFYLVAMAVAFLNLRVVLPAVSPVVALLVSAVLMGALFWYEERHGRRAAEALSAGKDQLAAMLVHDLRNAMGPVIMAIEALEDEQAGDPVARGRENWFLPVVRDASDMLMCQINSLLDIRRITDGNMVLRRSVVSVRELLGQVTRRFEHASRRAARPLLLLENPEREDGFSGDREIIERVLVNLIWNAIKYASARSAIELSWSRDAARGTVTIAVRNHCEPLPRERLEDLFSVAGVTADAGREGFRSMGLGLPFCKLAAEAHGGALEMESPCVRYGDGVEVRVVLPGNVGEGALPRSDGGARDGAEH